MAHPSRRVGEQSDGIQPPAESRALFTDFLISARHRAGCSLDEIALVTKVPARHLESLERGRVDDLPRGVYRRAIVRTYATAVGLDPTLVLERFGQVFGAETAFSEWETVPTLARPRPAGVTTATGAESHHGPATIVSSRRTAVAQQELPRRGQQSESGPTRVVVAATVAAVLLLAGYLLFAPDEPLSSPPAAAGTPAPSAPAVPADHTLTAETGSAIAPPLRSDPVRPIADTTVAQPAPQDVLPAEPEDPVAALPVESRLVITSNPAGARVTVDGVGWGVTPITIRHLSPGVKVIRLTKDGYVGQEREVRIGEDGAAAARITLQPRN
jgi:cytoskeletal protein RodZ